MKKKIMMLGAFVLGAIQMSSYAYAETASVYFQQIVISASNPGKYTNLRNKEIRDIYLIVDTANPLGEELEKAFDQSRKDKKIDLSEFGILENDRVLFNSVEFAGCGGVGYSKYHKILGKPWKDLGIENSLSCSN